MEVVMGQMHKVRIKPTHGEDEDYIAVYSIECLFSDDAITEALDLYEIGYGIPRDLVTAEVIMTVPIF